MVTERYVNIIKKIQCPPPIWIFRDGRPCAEKILYGRFIVAWRCISTTVQLTDIFSRSIGPTYFIEISMDRVPIESFVCR